jgi:DNA-binding NarL/FixJ family response regulator
LGIRSWRIVIADKQPVVLCGLQAILRAESDFEIIASCGDGLTCIEAIRASSPDLVLVDISLSDDGGAQLLSAVRTEQAATRVVFLSASSAPSEAARAIARGAYGVVSRASAPDVLLRSLRQVALGLRLLPLLGVHDEPSTVPQKELADLWAMLTEREREITYLVCAGLSNKQVGRQLHLSEGTIKVHLHNIYQKLAINNRTALAALGTSGNERPFVLNVGGQSISS